MHRLTYIFWLFIKVVKSSVNDGVMVWTLNSQLRSQGFNPIPAVLLLILQTCASVTKQYNLVLVKRWWFPAAGKVSVYLALHWLQWFIHLSSHSLSKGSWEPHLHSWRMSPFTLSPVPAAKLYIIFLIIVCRLYFQRVDISISAGAWVSFFSALRCFCSLMLLVSLLSTQQLCLLKRRVLYVCYICLYS